MKLSAKDFQIFDQEYPAGFKMSAHSDLHPKISVVVQGGLTESVGLRHEEAGRFSMVFKAADVIHQNKFHAPSTRIISFLPHFELLKKYELTGLFDQWYWMHEGPGNIFAAKMVKADYLDDHESLIEHFFSLLSHLSEYKFPQKLTPARWLLQVKEKLHDEFNTSYSVENIADYFGVHPVYLTRIFRQHFGCSITKYIRCLRVKKAARQLIETTAPLSNIALDQGFADQSHFTRQFRDELKLTPSAFRKTFN